ncbi:uncharacterized protein LOC130173760 isoform X1 [Seriola aureovittata]|uniref:uncharacterized protein LOC130173760 isoform X1 n=1 Tax=Seriola aureovittata TaxID=2871759 RepID=UPI0024BECF17|nr:uncharacterized protein LOC130173760 isoform X1 [Seriola aureovittata]
MYGQRTALILLGTASVIQTTEVPHHISLTVVEPGDNLTLTYHKNQKMSVHVKQSPETASVQLGASMTLQCSLLYTNKESRAQCPGEHSVHWFRAGSGGFHPGIIYTHSNRSDEQEERSCVYSLSKTIQNSSDAGTYYCAVVTCGEILFGEGTKVETIFLWGPAVTVLTVLLALCDCDCRPYFLKRLKDGDTEALNYSITGFVHKKRERRGT